MPDTPAPLPDLTPEEVEETLRLSQIWLAARGHGENPCPACGEHDAAACPSCRLPVACLRHGVSPRALRTEIARLTAEGAKVSAADALVEARALVRGINADTWTRRLVRVAHEREALRAAGRPIPAALDATWRTTLDHLHSLDGDRP